MERVLEGARTTETVRLGYSWLRPVGTGAGGKLRASWLAASSGHLEEGEVAGTLAGCIQLAPERGAKPLAHRLAHQWAPGWRESCWLALLLCPVGTCTGEKQLAKWLPWLSLFFPYTTKIRN